MFKRMLAATLITAAALCAGQMALRAQDAGPNQGAQDQGGGGGGGPQLTPAQQEQVQALQNMRDQVIQNMQNAGVDPQALRDQVRQQMQNGTFDPQALGQQLMNQGIISPDLINQARGTVQTLSLSIIRQSLASPDDEWAILQPKLQRVLNARADYDRNSGNAGALRFVTGQNQQTDSTRAMDALNQELDDPQSPPGRLAEKLQVWRDAHANAKKELDFSVEDLRGLLTLRQEAILTNIGLL